MRRNKNVTTGQGKDYRLIAVDLSRKKKKNADSKEIKQIELLDN